MVGIDKYLADSLLWPVLVGTNTGLAFSLPAFLSNTQPHTPTLCPGPILDSKEKELALLGSPCTNSLLEDLAALPHSPTEKA
jgi:hypothetical protein